MTQRTILITGCSSGIGLDAAHTLAQRGWRVLATCRQEKDCEILRAEGLESFVLNYENTESVQAGAAQALRLSGGKIDALFNNGAYAIPGLVEDLPRNALRAIFDTNVFGQFELINLLLPAMRQQGHGRIVNCSSVLGFAAELQDTHDNLVHSTAVIFGLPHKLNGFCSFRALIGSTLLCLLTRVSSL